MHQQKLFRVVLILLTVVLSVIVLVYGKPFLVPVTIAALLSMLLLPSVRWLRSKGVNETIGIILAELMLLGLTALLGLLITLQIRDLTKESGNLETKISEKYHQLQQYIKEQTGMSYRKQKEIIKEQEKSSSGKTAAIVTGILSGISGFLTDFVLVFVYIFLFISFRSYFKRFILRTIPEEDKPKAEEVIQKCARVGQKYLGGMAVMIGLLWVMYSAGFAMAGVQNPVFFAVLCGILEIVPFFGNLLGTLLTLSVSVMQQGDSSVAIPIIITYGIVQFIQTYLLEPLVVGSEVNINPLFTIVGLIAGEFIWGIAGMVMAIPVMGIIKIICDNQENLKAFGEMMGQDKKEKESSFQKKIASFFSFMKKKA